MLPPNSISAVQFKLLKAALYLHHFEENRQGIGLRTIQQLKDFFHQRHSTYGPDVDKEIKTHILITSITASRLIKLVSGYDGKGVFEWIGEQIRALKLGFNEDQVYALSELTTLISDHIKNRGEIENLRKAEDDPPL